MNDFEKVRSMTDSAITSRTLNERLRCGFLSLLSLNNNSAINWDKIEDPYKTVLKDLVDCWGDGKLRRGRPKTGMIVLDQLSRDHLRRLAAVSDPCDEQQRYWSDSAILHFSQNKSTLRDLIAAGWVILMPDEHLKSWVLKRTTVGTKAVLFTFC